MPDRWEREMSAAIASGMTDENLSMKIQLIINNFTFLIKNEDTHQWLAPSINSISMEQLHKAAPNEVANLLVLVKIISTTEKNDKVNLDLYFKASSP